MINTERTNKREGKEDGVKEEKRGEKRELLIYVREAFLKQR